MSLVSVVRGVNQDIRNRPVQNNVKEERME